MKKKLKTIIGFVSILLVMVFLFLGISSLQQPKITVLETRPANKAVGVPNTTSLDLVFNKGIKEKDKQKISLEIDPQETIKTIWLENQLTAVAETPLKNGVVYTIVVKYKNKEVYRFVFETILFTEEQIQEEGSLQSEGDLVFGEAYKKFITDFPWYLGLPVEKTEYRIVYDFEKKSFRIRLKIPTKDADQEQELINRALEDLKKIGVKEPISYYLLKTD